MHDNPWQRFNNWLAQYLTPAVRGILIANVVIFFLFLMLSPLSQGLRTFFYLLMQTPELVVKRFFLWQLVTYMYMHGGFGHLLVNMLVLWFFGPRLEQRWGTGSFLIFYHLVGVGAGLFNVALALVTNNTDIPMLGASGAIYGILLAYALYYPNDVVLLYFVIPVKIKWLVLGLGLITFFSSFSGTGSGISHITHMGGLVVAFFYLRGWRYFGNLGGGGGGGSGGFGGFGGGGGGGGFGRPRRGGKGRPTVIEVDPSRHPDFR